LADRRAGIGAAGLAHAVTHGGDVGAQDAESWVTMGLSIAASKYVGKKTHAMKERLLSASQQLGAKTKPQFDALAKRATDIENIAAELGARDAKKGNKPPTPEEALGLMRKHHELAVAEHQLLSREHPNDARTKASRADATADPQLVDATLQLAHLSPVIDGHLYEGTPKQIQDAFKAADSTGVPLKREWFPERSAWEVHAGNRKLEIHETLTAGKKSKPHESRNAADEVPGSHFKGQNRGAAPIQIKQVMTAVDEAALILNFDVAKTGPRYHKVGDTITFAEGSNYMVVKFRVGEPSTGPARHNYAEGSTDVTVTVSREARPQDLRRALAHELAELHAYVTDRKTNRDGVLHEGSKPTERNALAGHDVGRVAELRVLLHELAYAPASRTPEIRTEIDRLVEHLGFDPRTIGADPRARKIFGEDMLKKAYEYRYADKNRMPIELDPKKHITDNGTKITETTEEWMMQVGLVINGNEQLLVHATAPLHKGKPTRGPEFSINNTYLSGGVDYSITLTKGGSPIKLTEFVLKEATERFTKRFGHAPPTLNGHLTQDNRLIFQKAYAAEAQRFQKVGKRVDPQVIGAEAMKQTPFYKARERDYDMTMKKPSDSGWTEILYGDPPELVRVPDAIDIDAVKKK
jgi:hypothetical protein